MIVNGLPLPPGLLALIGAGRWRSPSDQSGLDLLFPDRSEFCCYSFQMMESEHRVFSNYPTPMWLGTPDPANPPGDIDPKLAVLIADLGIGYDQPIALDYRPSLKQPRVLTLRWDRPAPPVPWEEIEPWRNGQCHYDKPTTERLRHWCDTSEQGGWNRWVEIAPDFQTFAQLILL